MQGSTDYISVVVRHTLVQLRTPDEMRGRVSAINNLFIGTSNEMGEFESGFVAACTSSVFAVVSGGVGTILVVIVAAWLWPEHAKNTGGWIREGHANGRPVWQSNGFRVRGRGYS